MYSVVSVLCHHNFLLLTDINECEEGISGCSQLCNNTVGGYFCSCMAGYSLLEDGSNCVGKYMCTFYLSMHNDLQARGKY